VEGVGGFCGWQFAPGKPECPTPFDSALGQA
jgi:hypothetical protein